MNYSLIPLCITISIALISPSRTEISVPVLQHSGVFSPPQAELATGPDTSEMPIVHNLLPSAIIPMSKRSHLLPEMKLRPVVPLQMRSTIADKKITEDEAEKINFGITKSQKKKRSLQINKRQKVTEEFSNAGEVDQKKKPDENRNSSEFSKSLDPLEQVTDEEPKLVISSSPSIASINAKEKLLQLKARSSDNDNSIDELDYLTNAANPILDLEQKAKSYVKKIGHEIKHRLDKFIQPYNRNNIAESESNAQSLDHRTWASNINTNAKNLEGNTANIIMDGYSKILDIGQTLKNSKNNELSPNLRTVMNEFKKHMSEMQMFKNSGVQNRNNKEDTDDKAIKNMEKFVSSTLGAKNFDSVNTIEDQSKSNERSLSSGLGGLDLSKIPITESHLSGILNNFPNVIKAAFSMLPQKMLQDPRFLSKLPELATSLAQNILMRGLSSGRKGYDLPLSTLARTSPYDGYGYPYANTYEMPGSPIPGMPINQGQSYDNFYGNYDYQPETWSNAMYQYKRSIPTETSNATLSRNSRQLPLFSLGSVQSAGGITNTALNLAQSILANRPDQIANAGVNLGTGIAGMNYGAPQYYKRNSEIENSSVRNSRQLEIFPLGTVNPAGGILPLGTFNSAGGILPLSSLNSPRGIFPPSSMNSAGRALPLPSVNSAGGITSSALGLAQSIIAGRPDQIANAGINMGTTIGGAQLFKRAIDENSESAFNSFDDNSNDLESRQAYQVENSDSANMTPFDQIWKSTYELVNNIAQAASKADKTDLDRLLSPSRARNPLLKSTIPKNVALDEESRMLDNVAKSTSRLVSLKNSQMVGSPNPSVPIINSLNNLANGIMSILMNPTGAQKNSLIESINSELAIKPISLASDIVNAAMNPNGNGQLLQAYAPTYAGGYYPRSVSAMPISSLGKKYIGGIMKTPILLYKK